VIEDETVAVKSGII